MEPKKCLVFSEPKVLVVVLCLALEFFLWIMYMRLSKSKLVLYK